MRCLVVVCWAIIGLAGCVRLGFEPQAQPASDARAEGQDGAADARDDDAGSADAQQVADQGLFDGLVAVDGPAADLPPPGTYTWTGGSNTANPAGSYGTLGVPAASNAPSGRYGPAIGADSLGRVWLFGGNAGTSSAALLKSDLWRFDKGMWTWVAGPSVDSQPGIYGTRGVPASANRPGARQYPAMWVDSQDNIWVFGGWGRDEVGTKTRWLNDLWRFDGTSWTWIAGSAVCDPPGVYGTLGVPDAANTPGGRDGAGAAVDGQDRLWLFGGKGHASSASEGLLNDVWRFEGGAWVWLGGSTSVNPAASYGTVGVADPANHPGAKSWPCAWHAKGSLWVFGGAGFDSTDTYRLLNDLWRFDGTSWTWVAGSNVGSAVGVYGQQGIAAPGNQPGARWKMGCWTDGGDLVLFGGNGYASTTTLELLNDLWRFDGASWTWIGGSDTVGAPGVYGTRGVPSTASYPGARTALGATTGKGGGWVFGGDGYDAAGQEGVLNDLWLLSP
jgi:N-acetylneuraminic acid mutarotase